MPKRKWNNESRVLFVEGYSDLLFYAEVLEEIGVSDCFIQDLGSKSKLKEEAILLLKPNQLAKMRFVGVIIDADESAAKSFSYASRCLKDVCRVEIAEQGQWYGGGTKFGVFIAGEDSTSPELESLIWRAWKAESTNSSLHQCVDQFIQCLDSNSIRTKSLDKVRMGAVLSVLNEDDPRIGPAARANLFDFNNEIYTPLKNFLKPMA